MIQTVPEINRKKVISFLYVQNYHINDLNAIMSFLNMPAGGLDCHNEQGLLKQLLKLPDG
jgi:hypothetical protein